jgi:hypothetical protein
LVDASLAEAASADATVRWRPTLDTDTGHRDDAAAAAHGHTAGADEGLRAGSARWWSQR